jgi:O-antigen/teichoic acid export membrane protein
VFIPNGIGTLLMPKFASATDNRNKGLFKRMLVLSTAGNLFLFIVYVLAIQWVTITFFGVGYVVPLIVSVIYASAIIVAGIYRILVSYAVGINHPEVESIGRVVAVIAMFALGLWLIPNNGALGASIAKSIAMIGQLLTTGFLVLRIKDSLPT